MSADLIIRRGRVIDPANNIDKVCDVAVKGGHILAVGEDLPFSTPHVVDGDGHIVTPGLIDCHVHCYQYCTPLGVNVDKCCLARGTTTVVDAGSAGAATFPGLRKFIAEKSTTRVLALLHIAAHGLAAAGCVAPGGGGECDSLNQVDTSLCQECIEQNKDMIVGVKVRLATDISNNGLNDEEAYRRALRVCENTGLPLMTHHAQSNIPTQTTPGYTGLSCPGSLRPGDLYTHMYHAYGNTIVDENTMTVHADVKEARKRGVLFDVGHGKGSFSWTVAQACSRENFWPDTISTDVHTGNYNGPVYDLVTVMSRMLHLGMPLYDVIKATTWAPAKAVRKDNEIGALTVGHKADITVLKEKTTEAGLRLEDCNAQLRMLKKLLVPVAVFKDGHKYAIEDLPCFPNKDIQAESHYVSSVLISDKNLPNF